MKPKGQYSEPKVGVSVMTLDDAQKAGISVDFSLPMSQADLARKAISEAIASIPDSVLENYRGFHIIIAA